MVLLKNVKGRLYPSSPSCATLCLCLTEAPHAVCQVRSPRIPLLPWVVPELGIGLIFSRRGIRFSQPSLRLSLFFKELQWPEPLCILPSALGSWKSAQGLSGGLYSSKTAHSYERKRESWLPGLANTLWAPGARSWKVECKWLCSLCVCMLSYGV